MLSGHGASQLTFGNQLAFIGMHQNVPHVLAAPDMRGAAGGSDKTLPRGPQMVGTDMRSDRVFLIQINAHQRGKTANRFGQNTGGSAVQNAVNLVCAFIHGQSSLHKIRPDFGEFQAQMVEDIICRDEVLNVSDAVIFEPDHKGHANAFMGVRP